jgi:hypothetical protein
MRVQRTSGTNAENWLTSGTVEEHNQLIGGSGTETFILSYPQQFHGYDFAGMPEQGMPR